MRYRYVQPSAERRWSAGPFSFRFLPCALPDLIVVSGLWSRRNARAATRGNRRRSCVMPQPQPPPSVRPSVRPRRPPPLPRLCCGSPGRRVRRRRPVDRRQRCRRSHCPRPPPVRLSRRGGRVVAFRRAPARVRYDALHDVCAYPQPRRY